MSIIFRFLRNLNSIVKFNMRFPLFSKYRRVLSSNLKFQNINNGKRIYVLGNGPQLNQIKLPILNEGIVVAVNSISKVEAAKNLRIDYYFRIDPIFFKKEDPQILRDISFVFNNNPDAEFFFPIEYFDYLQSNIDIEGCKLNYLFSNRFISDSGINGLDFTKNLFEFSNVVHWGIAFAIYSGSSEIILIGQDNNWIIDYINVFISEPPINGHAYIEETDYKNSMIESLRVNSLYAYADSFRNSLLCYEKLNIIAKTLGIKLINTNPSDLIDKVEYVSLEVLTGVDN